MQITYTFVLLPLVSGCSVPRYHIIGIKPMAWRWGCLIHVVIDGLQCMVALTLKFELPFDLKQILTLFFHFCLHLKTKHMSDYATSCCGHKFSLLFVNALHVLQEQAISFKSITAIHVARTCNTCYMSMYTHVSTTCFNIHHLQWHFTCYLDTLLYVKGMGFIFHVTLTAFTCLSTIFKPYVSQIPVNNFTHTTNYLSFPC